MALCAIHSKMRLYGHRPRSCIRQYNQLWAFWTCSRAHLLCPPGEDTDHNKEIVALKNIFRCIIYNRSGFDCEILLIANCEFLFKTQSNESQEKEYAMNNITCDHTPFAQARVLERSRSQTCMCFRSHVCLIYLHACTYSCQSLRSVFSVVWTQWIRWKISSLALGLCMQKWGWGLWGCMYRLCIPELPGTRIVAI